MPQFDTEYEAKLFADRQASLDKIAAVVRRQNPTVTELEARFPNSFRFTHTLAPSIEGVPGLLALGLGQDGAPLTSEQLEANPVSAAIAGRLMAHRSQGKAGFAQLQQGGERIQIYVRKDDAGEDAFELYKALHVGDHIGVRGTLMRTRTGELTLKVHPVEGKPAIEFLAKAMLALPDKYHGLEDVELRYRQRYVDLIMNSGARPQQVAAAAAEGAAAAPGVSAVTETAEANAEHEDAPRNVREVFVKRAAVLRAIRKFFDKRGYLEVETPMLHPIAGGAAARPFKTKHNALEMDLTLRIAPELYLKRLVVGGLDRVYEINRNFRNEGVSTRHNPEFTMLEFYQAYANYHDLMELTQELIQFVAQEVNGTTITHFNGVDIDLRKWTKLSMREAIIKWWPSAEGFSETAFCNRDELEAALSSVQRRSEFDWQQFCDAARETAPTEAELQSIRERMEFATIFRKQLRGGLALGNLIAALFEHLAESHFIQPTIIYDFPLAVSPLSKVKPDEPDWVERFEFYIGGFEVGNAFSELNDMADQEARFQAQVADKDPESMAEVDEDYVRALGYGLPPTAGEGIGIDRLTMLLTGSRSIRDVILFPLMRPHGGAVAAEKVAADLASPDGESAE